MTELMKEERCGEVNPLAQAHCVLRPGHEGRHWGHGPTWEWDESVCQIVSPSEPMPAGFTGQTERQ